MSADIVVAVPPPGTTMEASGLHSPPDSNTKDASDSELSDLEDQEPPAPEAAAAGDADDIGEVTPDYYSNDGVPVFKPNMDQFKDFTKFMVKVNSYGMRSGIIKVIPPAEWKAAQPRLDEAVKKIKIKEPIKQDIMGTGGTYRQANIVHQRSYNLPQWRQLCEQSDHQPPAKRGERRPNQDKPTRSTPRNRTSGATPGPASKAKGRGRPSRGKSRAATVDKEEEAQSTPDRLPTPVSPSMKAEEDDSIKLEPYDEDEAPEKPRLGSRQAKAINSVSVSSRRKNNRREQAAKVDEAAFKDFKYELDGDEYTAERCEELERGYWKTLTYAPPLYGADMPGTLFDERTTTWNLGKLDNILDIMGSKIPGVNTAYLYLGMWKATFAWHLEDVDLYSINYLHFGAPKQWYSIAQGDARRFEAAMKTIWPTDAKACDQFLRHKTFLISPASLLQNHNIKVNKIVHHPGEFVITYPYGYHSGYNLGYNCAEAVNFGLESWLEYGRVAKKCECAQAQDSVWIDVHDLERKLRGEETEYEETDDEEEEEEEEENETSLAGLPTPPESNGDAKSKAPKKKRKRPLNDKGENLNAKRIRVRIKAPTKEPCILCPNDIPSEPLLPTEDGQKAHRICAEYIPETSVDAGTVTDVKYINKARLDLKCNYCRSKKGACFQCSQKKCTRAYHATCAAAAGVFVQQGEIPVFGEDGTEYKDWAIEFSCRFHRTKRDKKLDSDELGDSERLRKAGLELKIGDVCQAQYYRGDIFAGAVADNRPDEETVLLNILPRGDQVEVEYKWLLIPDASEYNLPKPSPNAIPLPKSRQDKESLNTSKRQADDIPRADDPFVEGHTWAEFKNENIPINPFQTKIDFKQDNQIWFYLGKSSTEARAQFTEDPAKPRNNPKGNFLESIPKPPPAVPRHSYAASYPTNSKQPIPSTAKAPYRPAPPASTPTTTKVEKPYVYKPRNNTDMYRVDPQAYRSQQNFLQRSAPYTFGTDPRWRGPDSSSPNSHPNRQIPATAAAAAVSSTTPHPTRPLAPPTSYQPPYPAPALSKPSNPFGGRPQSSRPSVFAKYPYLQKEHNRSPLDYKSPYRPGGGFMNGYQGNLQSHLQQTLFQKRPSTSGTPHPNPALTAYQNSTMRPSQSGSQPISNPIHGASLTSGYTSYGTPSTAKQTTIQSPVTKPLVNSWEKKEPSQLHPAIRQEYHATVFHNQYQPPRPSPPQRQSSVLQPPPLYDRPPYQPQSQTAPHQPRQMYNPPLTPQSQPQSQPQSHLPRHELYNKPTSHQSLSASHPQQYNKSPPTPASSTHQPSPITSTAPIYAAQQANRMPVSQEQFQLPSQPQPQQPKAIYAHQQYFHRPEAPAYVPQQIPQGSQKYEPADVPVDSTSIIEKMIMNLKKATPSAAPSS
ncbi:hypothetical protein G7Y89_g9973 [Cudoniella acicularis]|uniref:[histone H3]-trimethyl-L-lysine(9) demethylase n=1 Tax=Cudoniella acicularis TaxID=354080 RepID=A0A8H4VZI0_9HELO|nr:hypothetical protein G7Y89_g9973 [Cudoniella acicularis]